jgi:hypothetical protein
MHYSLWLLLFQCNIIFCYLFGWKLYTFNLFFYPVMLMRVTKGLILQWLHNEPVLVTVSGDGR